MNKLKNLLFVTLIVSSIYIIVYNVIEYNNYIKRKNAIFSTIVNVDGASGFVIKSTDTYSYILTAYHVVDDNIKNNLPVAIDGKLITLEVVESNKNIDYAILKIYPKTDNVVTIKKSYDILDKIFSVGFPAGRLCISEGIISNLSNKITHTSGVYSGSSGGPLYDENFNVIGMNVSLAIVAQGYPIGFLSFAVPISTIIDDLGEEKFKEYFEK